MKKDFGKVEVLIKLNENIKKSHKDVNGKSLIKKDCYTWLKNKRY